MIWPEPLMRLFVTSLVTFQMRKNVERSDAPDSMLEEVRNPHGRKQAVYSTSASG
jgi:hypothetical protein